MRERYVKIFYRNPSKLYLLVNLRQAGWSTYSLAELFNVNRASIIFQLKKYQVVPVVPVLPTQRIVRQVMVDILPPKKNYIEIAGERINLGHDYADYLKQ
jgi:hypothetical protein